MQYLIDQLNMAIHGESYYEPFLPTAEAIVDADPFLTRWIVEVFPEATPQQLEKAKFNILGIFHEGISTGMGLTGHDPIGEVEAYQIGVKEGLEQGNQPK